MYPIFQAEDGKWYFWDECGLYDYGPFDTKELALAELIKYGEQLDSN